MKKPISNFFILIMCCILVGIFISILHNNPPPTKSLATINSIATNGFKKITFPAFSVSIAVPDNFKTLKQLTPYAEDTQIGSNIVTLYSPNTTHTASQAGQLTGIKLSILVNDTKTTFSSAKSIVPANSLSHASEDFTILPKNSSLLTHKTSHEYTFLADATQNSAPLVYYVEMLLHKKAKPIDVTIYCIQYSLTNESISCKQLLTKILPTLQL